MHLNSRLIFDAYGKPLFEQGMRVLELGPDGCPSTFQAAVAKKSIKWETLDISKANKPTYLAEEYKFPVPDNQFDIVLSGQVLEHVRKIWLWIKEIARVCKEGGKVITISPLSWSFHEYPVDCWRVYPEGMRALYEEAGLEVLLCSCENHELKAGSGKGEGTNILGIEDFSRSNRRYSGWRLYPGSGSHPNGLKGFIKKSIGWPVPVIFDTITIGAKI